jgi:AcrR family transcriptional regulator
MKRDLLLDSAEQLLARDGTQALTLAAVAENAGVSKGGLLYHFATKEALIRALVDRLITEFDALVATHDSGGPGSYTHAYVLATFDIVAGGSPDQVRTRRRWAVVAAAATAAELAVPLREALTRWHRRDPGDDPDPVTASLVRFAADGLWDALELAPDLLDQAAVLAVRDRCLELLGRPPAA